MESSIHNALRIISTTGHVLRTDKLTRHLPSNDESHIRKGTQGRLARCIYGRLTHRNKGRPRISRTMCPTCPTEITQSRPLPQTIEMRIPQETHRIPWSCSRAW